MVRSVHVSATRPRCSSFAHRSASASSRMPKLGVKQTVPPSIFCSRSEDAQGNDGTATFSISAPTRSIPPGHLQCTSAFERRAQ
jgi:hypothetical protein